MNPDSKKKLSKSHNSSKSEGKKLKKLGIIHKNKRNSSGNVLTLPSPSTEGNGLKNNIKNVHLNTNKSSNDSKFIAKLSTNKPCPKNPKPDIWFDDVPPALIASSMQNETATTKSLVKTSSFSGPTRRIAIDCEFVGVGFEGKDNALARVSIVNQFGHVLLDAYVRPKERVVDYRTQYSGIRPADLKSSNGARSFNDVHKEVAKLCKGRILVGHSLGNDLKVLMLSHPKRDIRDTSRYKPFRALFSGRTPSLRALTEQVLGISVQEGEHDSVEDARAAMRLYTSVKRVWESSKKNRTVNNNALKTQLMQKPDIQTSQKINAVLDIKSEYESGLTPSDNPNPNSSKSFRNKFQNRSKSNLWDRSRDRKCSKNRARFIEKHRRRRKTFASAALG